MLTLLFAVLAMAGTPDSEDPWLTETIQQWTDSGTELPIPEDLASWVSMSDRFAIELWFRDMAAHHATDAFLASDVGSTLDSTVHGYITGEAGPGGSVPVHWVMDGPDGPVIGWTVTMQNDSVVGWPTAEQPSPALQPALTPLPAAARARWDCRQDLARRINSGDAVVDAPVNIAVVPMSVGGVPGGAAFILPAKTVTGEQITGGSSILWCMGGEPVFQQVSELTLRNPEPDPNLASMYMSNPRIAFPVASYGFQAIMNQMPIFVKDELSRLWVYEHDKGSVHFLGVRPEVAEPEPQPEETRRTRRQRRRDR